MREDLGTDKAAGGSLTKRAEKSYEIPVDKAAEIQKALQPLGYKLMAFSDDNGDYSVRLRHVGFYSEFSAV